MKCCTVPCQNVITLWRSENSVNISDPVHVKFYSENKRGDHRNRIDPKTQGTMVKTKRSKTVDPDICKAICDMSCCAVRNKAIVEYYKLKPSTESNIIRRERKRRATTGIKKKTGPEAEIVREEPTSV